MSFPRYPAYKDSGVEWLGEVPEHWELRKLKHNLTLLTEKSEPRDLAVALENIQSWTGKFSETETELQGEGVTFESGDILFGKLRPYLAKAWLADRPGEAVGDFHVLRPASDVDGRFSLYQILTREFISIVDGSTFGAKMPRVSWDFLATMLLTTPPGREQITIATFLDRETAKIDALVAEYRTLIGLLKEKRQAVISHAVTKGLDPTVPMKDSGVEWLGEVPEHWEPIKIKQIFCQAKRQGYPDLPVLSVYREYGVLEKDSRDDNNNKTPDDLDSYQRVNPGDLVINKMKAWQGSLGISFHEGITSPDYIVYASIHKESNAFIHYMLRQRNLVGAYKAISNGIRPQQWRLEPGEFAALTFFLPPRAEQDKIAAFIAEDARQLDALAAEAEQGISLLQERRTALISAAVTGKIDVRGLATEAGLLEARAQNRADLAAGRFVVESVEAHMDRVEAGLDGGT